MPTFEYIAKQSDGSESKGVIYGASLDSAVADLQKRGLEVHSIHSSSDAGMGGFVGKRLRSDMKYRPLRVGRRRKPDLICKPV
jgi:type II secretory pathway component PulF